jgi:hypothetical protein
MKITIKHLKSRWTKGHIADMKTVSKRLVIGSEKIFQFPDHITTFVDAVWSKDHDGAVKKRDGNKQFHHIFISEMGKTAANEYEQVCGLFGLSKILLISIPGDPFFEESRELLEPLKLYIENVEF